MPGSSWQTLRVLPIHRSPSSIDSLSSYSFQSVRLPLCKRPITKSPFFIIIYSVWCINLCGKTNVCQTKQKMPLKSQLDFDFLLLFDFTLVFFSFFCLISVPRFLFEKNGNILAWIFLDFLPQFTFLHWLHSVHIHFDF